MARRVTCSPQILHIVLLEPSPFRACSQNSFWVYWNGCTHMGGYIHLGQMAMILHRAWWRHNGTCRIMCICATIANGPQWRNQKKTSSTTHVCWHPLGLPMLHLTVWARRITDTCKHVHTSRPVNNTVWMYPGGRNARVAKPCR